MVRPVRLGDKCKYCGESATCRDHVIPRSYLRNNRKPNWGGVWTVHCCEQCNLALGARLLFSIQTRAAFLLEHFQAKKKYRITEKRLKHLAITASREYRMPKTKPIEKKPKRQLVPEFPERRYTVIELEANLPKSKRPRIYGNRKYFDGFYHGEVCVSYAVFKQRVEAELDNFLKRKNPPTQGPEG